MGALDFMKPRPVVPSLAYNTGSLYDFIVGRAIQGIGGKWYIDGGLGASITGVGGMPNQGKSTIFGTLLMRAKGIYKGSDGVIVDTEKSLTKDTDRLSRFSGEFNVDAEKDIQVLSSDTLNATEVDDFLKEIWETKEAHKKDLQIELPLMDPETGKPVLAYMPSFIMIDSLSYLRTATSSNVLALGLDDPKIRTIYMEEGNTKTILVRKLRDLCEAYGLSIICTAHIDDTIEMNSFLPPSKQLQHMKQGQKYKYVGASFDRLTNNLVQVLGSTTLKDPNNEPLYGVENGAKGDLNEVSLLVQRCKTNASGSMFPVVSSQADGFLADVTNYHFLRANGYFGLNGSNQKHQPFLLPDVTVSRNTFREMASASYELRRAIELTAQWLFVKMFWNIRNMPMDMSIEPKVLFDALVANKSIKVNDILNSSGNWTYEKKPARPYMSIFDVIELINKK